MGALYRMACWTLAVALASPATAYAVADDADALYANRTTLADAQRAAALWQQRLSTRPDDYDAAWRLGRAGYWLGGHLPTEAARIAAFEVAMDASRKAIAAQPSRPDGYFWLAANMGGLAELKGLRAGIKYRTPVRQNLEKVLALDPAFQKGSADRALGRWYFKVPGLFGGSNKKSEEHLRKSLTYHPQSISSRYFLAETLEDMGRKADAIRMLQEISTLAVDPEWAPEDAEFKQQARTLLAKLAR
jgi:tetratricopeptide (TPR) repeat protein